jgi:hypothetical protein
VSTSTDANRFSVRAKHAPPFYVCHPPQSMNFPLEMKKICPHSEECLSVQGSFV